MPAHGTAWAAADLAAITTLPPLGLLGLFVIPLLAMALLVILSVGCLIRTGPSWAFGSIMISAAAAILWWGTSPGALPGLASRLVPATQDWRLLAPLIVFPLVCGVATGLQRICTSVRSKAGRLLIWSCVLVLLAADLGGSARTAVLQPASPTQQTLSTRIYGQERECVQASPGFTGEGFWPTDWNVTPSSLQSV